MMRFFIVVALFLVVSIIQMAFFTSLPEPFSLTPFLLVVSVYLIQRFGFSLIGWWIVFQGFILDFYHLSSVPFEFFSYSATAVIAVFASRSLFSNRSFYGVLGAIVTTLLSLSVFELLITIVLITFHSSQVQFSVLFMFVIWRTILAAAFLFLIYPFTEKILKLGWIVDYKSTFSR